jgi:hypothetical protein
MAETIVIYGNCQAGVYADALRKILGSNRRIRWVSSFDDPTQPQEAVSREDLESCTLVLEQIDSGRPMPETIIGTANRAQTVRFPPLDFNLLWPFNFNDPRNVSEPPDYPFGRFPYGDRIVVELLREGLTGSALWDVYRQRSVVKLPDMQRLRIYESKRLSARDEKTDVKVGALIMSEFKEKRLFWAINHPTGWLLGKVFSDIVGLCGEHLESDGASLATIQAFFENYEPFGHHAVPIHPGVVRQLNLAWCTAEQRYRYLDGSMMTFEETMRRYIDFS